MRKKTVKKPLRVVKPVQKRKLHEDAQRQDMNGNWCTSGGCGQINYVDYKHSYAHVLAPLLKKLNYMINVKHADASVVKGFIVNQLKAAPDLRVTTKESEFYDNLMQMNDSRQIYYYVKNIINAAKDVNVYVNSNGELTEKLSRTAMRKLTEAIENTDGDDVIEWFNNLQADCGDDCTLMEFVKFLTDLQAKRLTTEQQNTVGAFITGLRRNLVKFYVTEINDYYTQFPDDDVMMPIEEFYSKYDLLGTNDCGKKAWKFLISKACANAFIDESGKYCVEFGVDDIDSTIEDLYKHA